MSPDEREEAPHELKILAPTAVRMRLIAISAAILAVGSALAPARQGALPSRTEERANPLIEEQLTTSTPVAVTFSGVQDAARTSRTHVVEIRPVRRAVVDDVRSDIPRGAPLARGGAGVMVSDGYVLTHAAALDGRLAVEVVTDEGRAEDVVLAAYDPASGLVLLKSAPGLTPAAVLASGPPEAGSLAVAVGHDERRPIAQPAFVTLVGPGHVVITPAGPCLLYTSPSPRD